MAASNTAAFAARAAALKGYRWRRRFRGSPRSQGRLDRDPACHITRHMTSEPVAYDEQRSPIPGIVGRGRRVRPRRSPRCGAGHHRAPSAGPTRALRADRGPGANRCPGEPLPAAPVSGPGPEPGLLIASHLPAEPAGVVPRGRSSLHDRGKRQPQEQEPDGRRTDRDGRPRHRSIPDRSSGAPRRRGFDPSSTIPGRPQTVVAPLLVVTGVMWVAAGVIVLFAMHAGWRFVPCGGLRRDRALFRSRLQRHDPAARAPRRG